MNRPLSSLIPNTVTAVPGQIIFCRKSTVTDFPLLVAPTRKNIFRIIFSDDRLVPIISSSRTAFGFSIEAPSSDVSRKPQNAGASFKVAVST